MSRFVTSLELVPGWYWYQYELEGPIKLETRWSEALRTYELVLVADTVKLVSEMEDGWWSPCERPVKE